MARSSKIVDQPSEAALLERAFSLANEAMFTIALQRRRLRSEEPEDTTFVFRWWADLQFFIVALRRLRRSVELASHVKAANVELSAALEKFDVSLPDLTMMRNVGEHIDDYARNDDRRRYKHVDRRTLHVGTWDGTTYEWLGAKLNIDTAHSYAVELHSAIRATLKKAAAKADRH